MKSLDVGPAIRPAPSPLAEGRELKFQEDLLAFGIYVAPRGGA